MTDPTPYRLMGCGFSSAPMGIQTADGDWVMRASSMYRERVERMLKDANEAPTLRAEVERLSRTRSVATAGAYTEQNAALRADYNEKCAEVVSHKMAMDHLRSRAEKAETELARREDVMEQWWEDHKRITDALRSEIAEKRAHILNGVTRNSRQRIANARIQRAYEALKSSSVVLKEATKRRNQRARYTEDEFDRGAFNEAESMLAWLEGREAEPRHWEDRDDWVTKYDV